MRATFAELPDWQKVLAVMGATVAAGLVLTIIVVIGGRQFTGPRAGTNSPPQVVASSAEAPEIDRKNDPEHSREFTAAERETAVGMTIGEFLEADESVRTRSMRFWAQELHPEDSDDARSIRELAYLVTLLKATETTSLHQFSVEDSCRAADSMVAKKLAERYRHQD